MARKNNFAVYAAALTLFLGGVGYMAWSGLSEGSVYFLNVSEALAMPADDLRSARLFGTVSADGISRPGDGMGVRFRLQDAEKTGQILWVDYRGAVPDTFQAGAEVIVEGRMADGAFQARSLMTKCPSKYEKQNRKAASRA